MDMPHKTSPQTPLPGLFEMKVLLFILSFVTLSLCQDIVKEIKDKIEALKRSEINLEVPCIPFTLSAGHKLNKPHLKIFPTENVNDPFSTEESLLPTEIVFNPRVIIGFDDPSCTEETLLYVKLPVKLEVFQKLLELGAGPDYFLLCFKIFDRENLAFTGMELVESGLVEPEDLWAEAINSGDLCLFNYLLHDAGADLSYRIRYDGIDFSLAGYCILRGRIELLKILLKSGASLFNPPIAVLFNPSLLRSTFMGVVKCDVALAAALEPYLDNVDCDTSEYTILDWLVLFSNGKIPVKTVELLMEHNVPSKYPLTVAIEWGRCDSKIMSLIRSNPHERCPNFEPPISLLLCSRRNFVPEITELLRLGAELSIHWAAITSASELLNHRFLLPEHKNLAAKHLIRTGAAPEDFLLEAVSSESMDLLHFLLSQDADVHREFDFYGLASYTALGYSTYLERIDKIRLLISRPDVNLDAPHYWHRDGNAEDFWKLLMVRKLSFISTVFAEVPTLLDSFVMSLLKGNALNSLKPSFVPEFFRLLRKRVADSTVSLEMYKQKNADGWSILDLVAFNPKFSRVVDSDLIRTLHSAGIATKYPLALALDFFEPSELLNLLLDPSIDPNERTVGLNLHILVHLLRFRSPQIPAIVALVGRGAQLDASMGDLEYAREAIEYMASESLVELRDGLSHLVISGNETDTCAYLIEIIDYTLDERS